MKNKRQVNLNKWIYNNTVGSKSVVELGAGFFQNLKFVSADEKIGIEIYQPYIENAKYTDCVVIEGDVMNYRNLLKDYNPDTVLIVDVLEHFTREDGLNLINMLKEDFDKILLMLPIGTYEQEVDVTGYGGHEYQKHRSYWYKEDVEKLNFTHNHIDEYYHYDRIDSGLDTACYFGVWIKNDE